MLSPFISVSTLTPAEVLAWWLPPLDDCCPGGLPCRVSSHLDLVGSGEEEREAKEEP